MKKIIWPYGIIAGFISTIGFIITMMSSQEIDMAKGMLYGYASMLVAFSLIFVAVKNYRDKHNGGTVTFGKAFRIGLYISLIASTIYVAVWLIDYYFFIEDFYTKYSVQYLNDMQAKGLPQETIDLKMAEMKQWGELYKNPLINILMTYSEIIWVGIVLSLIAAGILKRETPKN